MILAINQRLERQQSFWRKIFNL